MTATLLSSRPTHGPSGRQRSIRRLSRTLPLRSAVRLAVDILFHFKCRATKGHALWSEAEQVWMGTETFLYWAIWDEGIDVPWAVAHAVGAPRDGGDLFDAVREELLAYWADQLASLPPSGRPYWMPLP